MGQCLLRWWLGCLQFPQDMSVHVGSAGSVLHVMPGGGGSSAYDGIDGSFGVTPISPLEFLLEAIHSFGGEIRPIAKSDRGFRVGSAFSERGEVGICSAFDVVVEVGENAKHLGGQYLKALFMVRQNRM